MSKIILKGDTSGEVAIQAPAVAGNTTIELTTAGGTILSGNDIGSTVQGYDANTAKYDDTTANFTGTLQQGGTNVLTGVTASDVAGANGTLGQLLQSDGDGTMSWIDLSSDPTMGGDLSGTASNAQIVANAVGANELNISGNGTSGQYLKSDGDGSFSWQTLNALTQSAYSSGSNGYLKLSNGWIIQWAYTAFNSANTRTGTFPLAFPNACRRCIGSRFGNVTGPKYDAYVLSVSTTQYTIYSASWDGGVSVVALGY